MVRLRLLFPALVAGLVVLGPSVRAEAVQLIEIENLPAGADKEDEEFFKKKQTSRQDVMDKRKAAYEQYQKTVAELQAQREKVSQLGTASVTIDEETKPVQEPANMETALGLKQPVRDIYSVSPTDFSIYEYERWSLNLSDFRNDMPQYLSGDITYDMPKTWFGFTFTVTNSTGKARRIAPMFTAVTNRGVFNHAVGGFLPERMMADAIQRPLAGSEASHDKELMKDGVAPLEPDGRMSMYSLNPKTFEEVVQPLSTFEPGQTRWGAALWTNFDNKFTELKIVVNGLTNANRYDEKMRRVMVLTYARTSDEYYVYRTDLKLKDKRWEYLWAWDQAISVPLPGDAKTPQIKVQTVKTPAGASKLMWAFPFVITNATRSPQEIAINAVSYVCPVEVDVGGAKVRVDALVVDDGRSTIYKTAMIKDELKKEATKDRYMLNKSVPEGSMTQVERRKTTIDAGKVIEEQWAVFDEADVDWQNVITQVETALTEKVDKKALAKANWEKIVKEYGGDKAADLAKKDPGFLYDPRRKLTEDEIKQVKEQIAKGLAGALDAAKVKKTVVAYFDCVSGLSSGSYRVSRSYRLPGVVDEAWLKAWEELDKGGAPAP